MGRIISQGVYTFSGPFHPFGGAVDIVVVEQQDGTFKSSPWYVRFGKFQGVLKAREKVVDICVNGVQAGFQMHLDHKGEGSACRGGMWGPLFRFIGSFRTVRSCCLLHASSFSPFSHTNQITSHN